jgi:hypothetical protein
MKKFRHEYRVFETTLLPSNQFEVILITNPDPQSDRRRIDRVTTSSCIGNLRVIVDWAHMDTFAVGKKFALTLEEL